MTYSFPETLKTIFYTFRRPLFVTGKNMGYTCHVGKFSKNLCWTCTKRARVPPNVVNDLRSAKLMIQISESQGAKANQAVKVDEYLGNVESILLAEAEKTFGSNTLTNG